jgi:putative redox protein
VALRRHAAAHDWTLGKITVGVRWSKDASGREHIERKLSFAKPLSGEQKKDLLGVAAATAVSRVLSGGIPIQSMIVD